MKRVRSIAVVILATLGITLATTAPSWATFEVNFFDCTLGTADFLVFGQSFDNGLGWQAGLAGSTAPAFAVIAR